MSLEPAEFAVYLDTDGPDRQQWAKVAIRLEETEAKTLHDVTVQVLVSQDPEQSLGALRQSAVDRAVPILRAALALFEQHDATQLKELQWSRREAADEEMRRSMPDLLTDWKGPGHDLP